jgi:hypothetical protein
MKSLADSFRKGELKVSKFESNDVHLFSVSGAIASLRLFPVFKNANAAVALPSPDAVVGILY